ncbi:MAG: hypothetical protein M3325_10465, partial [Actinomycetota bacterium]|nr:hypothetical protein [Actinomycetota bacterium]
VKRGIVLLSDSASWSACSSPPQLPKPAWLWAQPTVKHSVVGARATEQLAGLVQTANLESSEGR